MYKFNALEVKNQIVQWIRNFFEENGKDCNAIVGISGGKDSSIVAALCVEALGKDRVVGVLMPNGNQADLDMALLLCQHLGITHYTTNIKNIYDEALKALPENITQTNQATTNLPPRLRMAILYLYAQCETGVHKQKGRVANTCNLSEDWVGYSTRYGDSVGDFSPCSGLTVQEMKKIGHLLNLPECLIDKVPTDGLCGKTDEDNLGFTYEVLDKYIREGIIDDSEVKKRIDQLHKVNEFKLKLMPAYVPPSGYLYTSNE